VAVKKPINQIAIGSGVSTNSGTEKAIKDTEQNTVGKHLFKV
jgi:hypothetical protein